MKLVVNRCHGGFGLSLEAKLLYLNKVGYKNPQVYKDHPCSKTDRSFRRLNKEEYTLLEKCSCEILYVSYEDLGEITDSIGKGTLFLDFELERNDPTLLEVIEELGDKANNKYSNLEIVEIPDDVNYEITDYDGSETVEEVHRRW